MLLLVESFYFRPSNKEEEAISSYIEFIEVGLRSKLCLYILVAVAPR
jgi:hypothetical protein